MSSKLHKKNNLIINFGAKYPPSDETGIFPSPPTPSMDTKLSYFYVIQGIRKWQIKYF